MTLETAKQIVSEQGESASKEAQAVVRGGMTVCELTTDGRRTYPWVKVLPTETDAESSIEQALEMRRTVKTAISKKKQFKKEPDAVPVITPEVVPIQVTNIKMSAEDNSFSINSLISKVKQKLRELWKELDEIVVE